MQSQIYTPPMTKVNKILLIFNGVLFLLNTILTKTAGVSLASFLALSLGGVKSGLVFQFLTYPLIETQFMGLIFNGLLIWFIGSELEMKWGTKFYIRYLLISSVASGLVFFLCSLVFSGAAFGSPLMGLGGVTYALLVAYGIIYAERILTFMLIFPMKAKYFCLLLAGIQLYMGIFSGHGAVSFAHLSAMLIGFVYLKLRSAKASGKSIFGEKKRSRSNKNNLYIVGDDAKSSEKSKDPKYWQ